MPSMTNMTTSQISLTRHNPHHRQGLSAAVLTILSRYLLKRASASSTDHIHDTKTDDRYRQWRLKQLHEQLTDHFDVTTLQNKDILDFGCGTGELSRVLSNYGARQITGVDMSAQAIDKATRPAIHDHDKPSTVPTFIVAKDHNRIPLQDHSVDMICSFDVLEHVPDVKSVCQEWHRVLRHQGRVWIWWSPWRAPFGHHLSSLIPIPWVHLFLPQKSIFSACATLYDDPAFTPRKWDIDPLTNQKKPNKWHDVKTFEPFLNRLTKHAFEQHVHQAGLKIVRCQPHGFRGEITHQLSAILRCIPVIGDGFVSYYVYELVKS